MFKANHRYKQEKYSIPGWRRMYPKHFISSARTESCNLEFQQKISKRAWKINSISLGEDTFGKWDRWTEAFLYIIAEVRCQIAFRRKALRIFWVKCICLFLTTDFELKWQKDKACFWVKPYERHLTAWYFVSEIFHFTCIGYYWLTPHLIKENAEENFPM